MKPDNPSFPKPLHPLLSESARAEIEHAIAGGLGDLSLRQLLAQVMTSVGYGERKAFLEQHPDERPNGAYGRGLRVSTLPLSIEVPRTRSGAFRPEILPDLYKRGYPEEDRTLLMTLLSSSRSINAAKAALRKIGVSLSEEELDTVAQEFVESIKLKNTAPLPIDLLALYIDAKYVEIRDGDRVSPACIYVVIGLGLDGKKRILACHVELGRESLDAWKKVLGSLIERGLRRLLILVQDDFSGLLKVSQSLFPQTDIQLCFVHMQRNAKSHLPKDKVSEFMARLKNIKTLWARDAATAAFDDLCQDFQKDAPAFIKALISKRDHYLFFLDYPLPIRRSFSTTNAVETVNGQLERMRRNNGGFFHSHDTLYLKLGITIDYLENGRWRTAAVSVKTALHQLIAMFNRRFYDDT